MTLTKVSIKFTFYQPDISTQKIRFAIVCSINLILFLNVQISMQ